VKPWVTVATVIATLGVTVVLAVYQLRQIALARREYANRLEDQESPARDLEYAAVADDAIRFVPRLLAIPGFPTPEAYAAMSWSRQAIYDEALKDRELLAKWNRGMISVVWAASVALSLTHFLERIADWWSHTPHEASELSQGAWRLTLWFLVLVAVTIVPTVPLQWLRWRAIRAAKYRASYEDARRASIERAGGAGSSDS